jgi:uncharacterized membrane protein YfcA
VSQDFVITVGLLVLSVVSGMLGLGVAFAAVPFLGLFMGDLVHQIQPLSLLLNGLTGLFSTIGFARSGFVDWRKGALLAGITTVVAPVGALAAQYTAQVYIWGVYFLAVMYLAYRMFEPARRAIERPQYGWALVLAIPISMLSGFLGVGPGFLLLPTLILLGFEEKHAAGMNALAITPPSFSSLIPHMRTAQFNVDLTIVLLVVGAAGSYAGARLTSRYLPGARVKQIFGVLLVVTTLYKIWTLLR